MGNVSPIDWSRRHEPPTWLGPMLRQARLGRGLSLRGVATLAGLSRPYVWALEQSTRTPSRSAARASRPPSS